MENSQTQPSTKTHNETVKNFLKHEECGVQENQYMLTQTSKAETQRHLRPK